MSIPRSNRILLVLSKWMSALLFWLSIFNVCFSLIYFQDWRRIERCNYCDDHSIWFRLIDHLRFIDFPRFYLDDYGNRQVEAQAVRWFILIFLVITICSAVCYQNARRKLDAFKPKADHSPIPAVTEEVKVEIPQIPTPIPVKPSQNTKTPVAAKTTKAPHTQKSTTKVKTASSSNEIASRLGIKIWKTVTGRFDFVAAGSDRWLFKVDPSTDSAIETGIRSLGLPGFQGRCTWGSKHVSEGIYEPVLIACFGNKNKTLVVILHWNDFWQHDAAVNALSAHLKASATPNITFMPSIMLWDGKSGPLELMGYRFGFSINPSFGMMPLTNAFEGIRKTGMIAVEASHAAAEVGTIRTARFLPDFFSSTLEEGWFNE